MSQRMFPAYTVANTILALQRTPSTCTAVQTLFGDPHVYRQLFSPAKTILRAKHQLNRCVKGNYWPLRDNRVHDGKSKWWKSFSAINFWCKWELFSYFHNQRRKLLLYCFALSDVIVRGIFCENELVIWSTVLALRLFVIHWCCLCSSHWPSEHSAVTLYKGRKSGWGWHLVSYLNESRPQTHRSTAATLSVFVCPNILRIFCLWQ